MLIDLVNRKAALKDLNDLFSNAEICFVIHYSCESFYENSDGSSPRITSIAIRNLKTGQTHSFSIHKIAEIENKLGDVQENYNELERKMLDEYFYFVDHHSNHHWVHWNMRNINYGFVAIEHRHRVLGGSPIHIDDNYKHDLSRILINIYGVNYIGHPRLESLIVKNKISTIDFLTGNEEAKAFSDGEFKKLHQSTLKKTDMLANIMHRTHIRTLRTNNKWFDIYGSLFNGMVHRFDKHPIVKCIVAITAIGTFFYFVLDIIKALIK